MLFVGVAFAFLATLTMPLLDMLLGWAALSVVAWGAWHFQDD